MFYTVAPAQEPLREFSEEMVKTNTMQTMCAIHQSKGQLTSGESSTPTDFYVLNLHSPYLSQHTHITSIFSFINPCILRTFSYADLDVTFRNKCSSNTVNTIFRLWLRSDSCLRNCFSSMAEKERDREPTLWARLWLNILREHTHWLTHALFEFLYIVLVFYSLSAAPNIQVFSKYCVHRYANLFT